MLGRCSFLVLPKVFWRVQFVTEGPLVKHGFMHFIQWTLSILTTLYLEYLSISNKFSGPLNHFLSLSRKFTYSNFIFDSRINWNLNQNKSFDRKLKKKSVFCFQCRQSKNSYSSGDENTSIFMGSCISTNHCQLI